MHPPGSRLLLGRDHELLAIRAAFEAAERGKGALVLLVGEPGIGKTRLADEAAREAELRGARVTWGRAWEAGGAPAYWPWIEALRAIAGDTTGMTEAERRRIAPLARLLPELEPRGAALPPTDPAQERFRLFEAVAAFVALSARERPLVVVLDDLHAADVGSLVLLHFVARALHASRVVLIGTYRDVEARLSAEVGDALAKVSREGSYRALRRLARDEVADWAAREGAGDADALFAATEGNPLFVVEMLRLARDRGGAARLADRLPDGVRDVIRARLATLSAPARALLEAGSVLGRALDLGIVAALLDLTLSEARDLGAESARSDVLVATGDHSASFTHILIREVLYQELPAARRAELHARVARALLERSGSDSDAPLAEAVHHLFAASPVVSAGEAILWARRGAERAMRRLAFDEAAELLGRATERLPGGRDVERCDLLLELAGAEIGAGHATRGRSTSIAAATIARRLADPERLARAALRYGAVFVVAEVDRVLVGLLEEALAALPAGDGSLRARLLARLAAALQPATDPEGPITLARDAIDMARRVADDPTRLEVLVAGTSAMLYFGDPRERLPLDDELVATATRTGDRIAVLRGLMRLVFDHLELGDSASADVAIDEYDRLSRAIDLPALRWRAPVLRSMRKIMERRFDESEALCAEAAVIASRVDDGGARLCFALHTAGRLAAAERYEELALHLPAALDLLSGIADPIYRRSFRAGMLTRIGRAEEAREDLDFLVRHDPPLRGRPMLVWAAEASLALGDRDAARVIAPILSALPPRCYSWSPLAAIMEGPIAGWVARLQALVAARDGAAQVAVIAPPPVSSPPLRGAPPFQLSRDGELWLIEADATFRLRPSRGLEILARLVARPRQEHHVCDLIAPAGEPGHVEDAGEVLDARAIAAYKQRLEDLREAEAEATSHHDLGRASRAREEIEALADELARAVGLGGRRRKASSTAEKARVNVRQRLLDAITRIEEHSPALGKHLRQAVRTGTFCRYDP
jgi:tetratricopeptide (TPR) repeat protein